MLGNKRFNFTKKMLNQIPFNTKYFSTVTQNKNIKLRLIMPDLTTKEILIEENNRLCDLEIELKKNSFIQKVEFKSWDYCNISKENLLKYSLEYPLYLKIDKMEWQLVNNFNTNYEIQKLINFVNDIKLEKTDKFEGVKNKQSIYKDYREIEDKLRSFLVKYRKNISDDKLFELAIRLYSVKSFYKNEMQDRHFDNKLNEIFENYYDSKEELGKMNLIKTKLENRAALKAKLLILLAPFIFLIQLILIYCGTFQIYSWDITEPMTYLMSIANFSVIMFFRRRIGNEGAHVFYTNRFFSKYVRRRKFDMNKYNELKLKVEKYENYLK